MKRARGTMRMVAALAAAMLAPALLATGAAATPAGAAYRASAVVRVTQPAAEAAAEAPSRGEVPLGVLPGYDAAKAQAAAGLLSPPAGSPSPAAPSGAPPALAREFAGPAFTGWFPPDPGIAAGPSQVVATVNEKLTVYSKTGTKLGSVTLQTLFGRPGSVSIFDPKIAYDPWGKRFIVAALESDGSTYSYYHVAVSKSSAASAAASSWWRYRLDARKNGTATSGTMADYTGLGFDSFGAVYLTSNQFTLVGGTFSYAKIRVLRKSELYAGSATIHWTDFWNMKNANGSTAFGLQPAHVLSSVSKEYLVSTPPGGGSVVTLWRIANGGSAPALTRLYTIPVTAYTPPPNAQQLGGSGQIDTGDCRVTNAVYANGIIWTTFAHAWDFGSGTVSAVRWLGLGRMTAAAAPDYVYGSDGTFLFWPGIGVDATGNTYLVFGRSSATTYAGAGYAGWQTGNADPTTAGTLEDGTTYYDLGSGTGRIRWGDYAGICRDPSLGTVWIFHEYAVPDISLGPVWSTRLALTGF